MKTLVKNGQEKQRKSLSKQSSSTRKTPMPLFSYTVKSAFSTLTLSQQETGFSLALEMEKLEDVLRVTRFKLTNNPSLAMSSPDLYEAALLEIVLQGLIGLFSYAQRFEMSEILFILPQEEAIQISCFEGLFEECAPLLLGNEKRVSLTLSCAFQELFFEKINGIKTQIKLELWKAQRDDFYLRNYLQNHPKGEPLFFEMPETAPQEPKDNIISFPQRRND